MTELPIRIRSLALALLAVGAVAAVVVSGVAVTAAAGDVSVEATSFVDPGDDHTKIELAFDTDVDHSSVAPSDFTVYRDNGTTVDVAGIEKDTGADVADDDGQVVLDLGSDVNSVMLETVAIANGSISTMGGDGVFGRNVSVATTSTTITENGERSSNTAYRGERVAVYANDGGNLDEDFEIEADTDGDGTYESFVFSGSTGVSSQIYVFPTENRDLNHTFRVTFQSSDRTATLSLRDLGLTVDVSGGDSGGDATTTEKTPTATPTATTVVPTTTTSTPTPTETRTTATTTGMTTTTTAATATETTTETPPSTTTTGDGPGFGVAVALVALVAAALLTLRRD